MKKHAKSVWDILEEGVMLLKLMPAAGWFIYYLGTLPFMAGFLFFLQFMSQSPVAYSYVTWAGLGLALCFVWMKACQTMFAKYLLASRLGEKAPQMDRAAWVKAIRYHGITQWWSGPLYLISLALAVPFGWVNGFCQNTTIALAIEGVDHPRREALRLTWMHQKQNQALTAILMVFGFFVFLNIFSGAFFLPQLGKMLLGIDTAFSIAGTNLISMSFLTICLCLTYLVVDPLIKASYLLRVFYLRSLVTGEDLLGQTRALLDKVEKLGKVGALLILVLLFRSAGLANQASAEAAHTGLDSEALSQEIERVLQRPEFSWRISPDDGKEGGAESFFAQIAHGMTRMVQSIGQSIERILEWLERQFQKRESSKKEPSAGFPIDGLVLILVALALLVIIWLVARSLGKTKAMAEPDVSPEVVTPDLTKDDVVASDLPEDQWLALALENLNKGETRLALRAYFLALLAMLDHKAVIKVSMAKSNLDYLREARRRAHAFPRLDEYFKENILLFERAWYGLYSVDQDTLATFENNRKRMGDCVQS